MVDDNRPEIEKIKDNIKDAYDYFHENYESFNKFKRFVYDTTISDIQGRKLEAMGKPKIDFNILEPFISKFLGEFAKQEPSIEISSLNGNSYNADLVEILEQFFRYQFSNRNNSNARYKIMQDLLGGGFSVAKVWTDYSSPTSFSQDIFWDRTHTPTLCGFDPLAVMSHKGDGDYCFEMFPMLRAKFEKEHPGVNLDNVVNAKSDTTFAWSYKSGKTEIILVCDYYKKIQKPTKLLLLADQSTKTKKEYEKMVEEWDSFEAIPVVVEERKTMLTTIKRYKVCGEEIIEEEETDYTYLPLVFFDGNSVTLTRGATNNTEQKTRPLIYNCIGSQTLKNFAGISVANEIEMTSQAKYVVKQEALPDDEERINDIVSPQNATTLVVRAFDKVDPTKAIPEPFLPMPRVPMPPEFLATFQAMDSLIQMQLGSYDASLGINNNQLSGKAIMMGALQSNAAVSPYLIGFMQGLNRVAEIQLDLIPKYLKLPRLLAVLDSEGEKRHFKINQNNIKTFDYKHGDLGILVEASASSQVQKTHALESIIALMGASPLFAEFMNTDGLPILLDNMDIRGIDRLKQKAEEWMEKMEQQKQAMSQQPPPQDPVAVGAEVENARTQQRAQADAQKAALEAEKIAIEREKLELEKAKFEEAVIQDHATNALKAQEIENKEVELHSKVHLQDKDMKHKHDKEVAEHHHLVGMDMENLQASKRESE
ncbi:MAG TPA: hypothetical protein VIJ14_00370 [Rhabdochlamydiaceae bacterium]